MLRKNALVAIATAGACAVVSTSALAQQMYGSDTMFDVMTQVINTCGRSADVTYRGTGSGQGEKAMGPGDSGVTPAIAAQSQQIAPMSRFLNDNATGCDAIGPDQGQGITVGLDAISIVADNSAPTNTCNTLRFTGSIAGYTFDDWRDVLRVVYTGQTQKLTGSALDPCSANDPSRVPSAPGAIIGRCDGPVRQALVANWGNMFEGGCTNGDCPTGLRHAFRRDDVSGTTDTFLTLLGLPAATARTFCNGFDTEDLDPIRRPCDANEQVCATIKYANRKSSPEGAVPPAGGVAVDNASTDPSGDLGLVLPISMPTNPANQYGAACALGKFAYVVMPFAGPLEAQRCPDGNGRSLGKCRWPQAANNTFNCRAVQGTRPPIRVFVNMDGRSYNLIPRDPATGTLTLPATGIQDPRWGGGGWYKIHQTAAMANGSGTCTQTDATRQIGCLVNADPCSIGYAGRESAEWMGGATPVKALNVRTPQTPGTGVAPTDANVLLLLDPSGSAGGACNVGPGDNFGNRYPLARKLWINASKGLANVTDATTSGGLKNERQLLDCIQNRAGGAMDNAIDQFNFIKLPAGAYPVRTCP
jgi:ABC-type phosphate transport system substrate-binding protein